MFALRIPRKENTYSQTCQKLGLIPKNKAVCRMYCKSLGLIPDQNAKNIPKQRIHSQQN